MIVEDSSQPGAPDAADVYLGSFDPPNDFDHGEEFESARPRPIPARLRNGSWSRSRRRVLWTLILAAGACLAFAPLPFMKTLGYYILVLQYLGWIGFGLLAIAGIAWVSMRFNAGRFEYVRDGVPIIGRIVKAGPTIEGVADLVSVKFAAEVEYRDSETEALTTRTLKSEEAIEKKKLARYSLAVAPGDYVTLVALPDKPSGSLKLYGFLGLDPEREFVLKDGRPPAPWPPVMIALAILGFIVVLGLALAAIYIVKFCTPIDGDPTTAVIPAIVGITVGVFAGIKMAGWEQRDNPGITRGRRLFFVLFVGPALGAMLAGVMLFLLNAVADQSPPDLRPVEIEEYWTVTHYPLFVREYEIEYGEFGVAESRKHPATVEHMARFQPFDLGAIDVGKGAFGLSWVRGIYPIRWFTTDPAIAGDVPTVALAGPDGDELKLSPYVVMNDGRRVAPPAALSERAVEKLRATGLEASVFEK